MQCLWNNGGVAALRRWILSFGEMERRGRRESLSIQRRGCRCCCLLQYAEHYETLCDGAQMMSRVYFPTTLTVYRLNISNPRLLHVVLVTLIIARIKHLTTSNWRKKWTVYFGQQFKGIQSHMAAGHTVLAARKRRADRKWGQTTQPQGPPQSITSSREAPLAKSGPARGDQMFTPRRLRGGHLALKPQQW